MPGKWPFATPHPGIVLEGVHQPLVDFLAHLDAIHFGLFGRSFVITSGKDGQHAPGSLHAEGKAVDIRTEDKDPQGNMLFLMVLVYAVEAMPITIFDERNLPGNPHIHIEWHGA